MLYGRPMCSFCLHLVNTSDANGGPLSIDSLLGGPHCEISYLIFWVIGSAAFDEILYRYG